jgi:hypothetical protein
MTFSGVTCSILISGSEEGCMLPASFLFNGGEDLFADPFGEETGAFLFAPATMQSWLVN